MTPSLGIDVLVQLGDRLTAPLRDVEGTIAKASERMNKRLQLSMKLAGGGAAAAGIAYGAQRLVTGFTDSIRAVERAKGELATLGVRDLDAVVRKGQEMQMQLAGVTADAFVRASYDIKSGISSLSDQGVAEMTAAAMTVAKATKGVPEQMTSLFATSYGIFKDQYAIMSDADFGNMFGAALSASVQQFKTDGSKMQQAIESAGSGAVNLGMQMTEQLALLGMMQQKMQAGEAGTALRAFATNAAKAHEAFGDMKITTDRPVRVRVLDENGQLRAMPDILADLKARYGETLNAFEAAEIKEAFGTDEAMKLIDALYGQEEAVRANAAALEDAAGQGAAFTEQMARAADSNWDAAMVLMGQRFDVLKQKIGERLLPVVERLLPVIDGFITKAFDWIDANPALVTGIGAVVVGLGALAAILAPILLGASALISGWATMSFVATKLAVTLFSTGSVVGKLAGTLIWLAKGALPLVGKAIMMVGRALIANPIGVIIMAIAGAAYLIYRYWEPISAFFAALWARVVTIFNDAVAWVSDAINGIMSFDWANLFTIEGLTAAWAGVTGFLGGVLGTLWDALSPLSWLGIVKSEDLGAAWSGVTSFVSGTAGKVWDAVTGVDWASLLTLDGLRGAWSGVTGYLGGVLGKAFDLLHPLSWLGIVKSEDLSAAWSGITSFVSGTAGKVWNTVTGIDWAGLLTLDGLRGAWSGITGYLGGVLGKAFDLLSPLSWAGIVKSEDLGTAWAGVTSFVSGAAGKVWDSITGIDWGNLITAPNWSNWLTFSWGDVLPDWDWGAIIPDLPDIKGMFGDANETIDVRLENRATNVIGQEWQEGLDLVNQYRDGLIDLEGVKARLGEVANGGGVLFDGLEVNRAQDMLALLQEIEATKASSATAQPEITNPETLLQAAQAANELETRFPAITAAANETLSAVQNVLAQIATLVQGTDLTTEGARIAKSIADGIISQIGAVRAASAQIASAIRSALPNSARVNVNVAGSPTAVQARATGGRFNPGWLLTGEEGPELEYRSEGGYIAHHQALQRMVGMASRARDIVSGISFDALHGGQTPELATVAASGGVSQRSGQISYSPQFHMPLTFPQGADIEANRAMVREELALANEQAQADLRRNLHD